MGYIIEKSYNSELTSMIEKLKNSEKELSDYKEHLEDKVKEKTFFLEETNYKLKRERERLDRFNSYINELNSVDISFLANSATRHLLDITSAHLTMFYAYKDNELHLLSSSSKDTTLTERLKVKNGGIVKKAFESGEIIHIDDISDDLAIEVDLGFYKSRLKYIRVIPLIYQDKKIGVVLIASISDIDLDKSYLNGYINTLIQSLNNAVTFVEVQKQSIELQNINNQLEESNRLKSEFLANVSHELRTPLNSIIGFSNILLKNKSKNLENKQIDRLQKINKNGMHLLELINNILDLSKIEAGKMELDIRKIDIVSCINEVVELLKPQAQNGGKSLSFVNNTNYHQYFIESDEQKIKQIVINLVSNSIKFVESGSGKVEVIFDIADKEIKICVKDNGIGIEEDKLQLIFEAFRQADGSTTRKYGGTGLGLNISKNLSELIGGMISVKSKINEGSTFCLHLNSNSSKENLTRPLKNLKNEISKFGKIDSILSIDDTKDTLELIKEYIGDIGCKFYSSTDPKDALKLAKELKPSLITLDIMMPEMNGWEILKELKREQETKDIPVFLVSSIANQSKAYNLGALDTIIKPFSKDDIVAKIDKYFNINKTSKVLIVDDESEVREVIREYIAEYSSEIKEAANGKEALDVIESGFLPDIVFLDLMMPKMSGFDFVEYCKTNSLINKIKILVVTAKDLTDREKQMLINDDIIIISKGSNLEKVIQEIIV